MGDPPAHAAVSLESAEVHLSRTEPNPGGFWLYFAVDDVDAYHDRLVAAGVMPEHPPEDQTWDMREMVVVDPVGNQMTFASPRMAREPKIPVTRVNVPLRLEARMAAVLRDLADHKGMSLTELMEETLLHTFEPWKDGVASSHTAADLRRIQELKERHRLDYGVHGSYRFEEEVGADRG